MVPGRARKANARPGNAAEHLLIGAETTPNATDQEPIRSTRRGISAAGDWKAPRPEPCVAWQAMIAPCDRLIATVTGEDAPGAGPIVAGATSIGAEPGPRGSDEAPIRTGRFRWSWRFDREWRRGRRCSRREIGSWRSFRGWRAEREAKRPERERSCPGEKRDARRKSETLGEKARSSEKKRNARANSGAGGEGGGELRGKRALSP
jgi:hypothetical protein